MVHLEEIPVLLRNRVENILYSLRQKMLSKQDSSDDSHNHCLSDSKNNNSRASKDLSYSTTSSPTNSNSIQDDNDNSYTTSTTKVFDSLVTKLFRACSGNNCTSGPIFPRDDQHDLIESLEKKQQRRLTTRKHSNNSDTNSNNDKYNNTTNYNIDGYTKQKRTTTTKLGNNQESQHSYSPHTPHREKICVAGSPYRLYEVDEHESINTSLSPMDDVDDPFDDGISALSAHTLEEMVRAEAKRNKLIRAYIPQEQGFAITAANLSYQSQSLEQEDHHHHRLGPPSPAITVGSSTTGESPLQQKGDFPWQMRKVLSGITTSTRSSKSHLMIPNRPQDQSNNSKANQPMTPQGSTSHNKKKKRKGLSLFIRRNGYIQYEEDLSSADIANDELCEI
jgi:hypothetical protein